MKKVLVVLIIWCVNSVSFDLRAQNNGKNQIVNNQTKEVKIDKIEISKNWISRDFVIKKELLFEEGDTVTFGQIDASITNVWNIGNFSDVHYSIIQKPEGNTLELTAHDAVKFYPALAVDHSSKNDYQYVLGYGDGNFLGTNVGVNALWDKKPTGTSWVFNIAIPRQLLYKNMTAQFGFNKGEDTKVFLEREVNEENGKKHADYKTLMLAPYHKLSFNAIIGNPWHLDYEYKFTPNFSLSYSQHQVDHSLVENEDFTQGITVPEKEYTYLGIGISESVGIINIERHRKDGYRASASYNVNVGLMGTKSFHGFGLGAEYHKIFSKLIQFSARANTGLTTASDQYKFIMGPGDVLGLRYGELFGKKSYSAYAGSHFTWINNKWISVENAYFLNWGAADDSYSKLFTKVPTASIGTFIEFRLPIAPIVAFRLTFMYAGVGTEWFKFNM